MSFVSNDVMSRLYTGNVIWKDDVSWGASCEKEKKKTGKSYRSERYRSQRSRIHIP